MGTDLFSPKTGVENRGQIYFFPSTGYDPTDFEWAKIPGVRPHLTEDWGTTPLISSR
ncbi:hypothetical protein SAMN05216526_0393 [Ectothiorhodosinus mongolicus]|uniref:Uncharacterized protein n=1 Tax=Ectothiorhodosinus mongolicus TaxID=233100 RepID=A0A1R3VPS3_9GAMM|nr:hypothetical protein SAMN05216526_0393 [Ectothiorhodosinus mongolicus]